MAHFAKLGVGNIVEQVIVVSNDIAITEQAGVDFINKLYNTRDVWKQTSYNTLAGVHLLGGTPFRKNYAGIGFQYDQQRDAFIPPKPFNSWILNEDNCRWIAPKPYPETYNLGLLDEDNITPIKDPYIWNESIINWEIKTR
jgi:hypothetical protein